MTNETCVISVIVASAVDRSWKGHEQNVAQTVGLPFEYLRVQNENAARGISELYNGMVPRARGRILVFMHEDLFFLTPDWGELIAQLMDARDDLNVVGLAGAKLFLPEQPLWTSAGQPHLHGRVIHEDRDADGVYLTLFSVQQGLQEVVVADGLFLAVRASLFEKCRFDSHLLRGFHGYDVDFCLSARAFGKIGVTADITVKHLSGGAFADQWRGEMAKVVEKHRDGLPAMVTGVNPVRRPGPPFGSVDLVSSMTPETYESIKLLGRDYPRFRRGRS